MRPPNQGFLRGEHDSTTDKQLESDYLFAISVKNDIRISVPRELVRGGHTISKSFEHFQYHNSYTQSDIRKKPQIILQNYVLHLPETYPLRHRRPSHKAQEAS